MEAPGRDLGLGRVHRRPVAIRWRPAGAGREHRVRRGRASAGPCCSSGETNERTPPRPRSFACGLRMTRGRAPAPVGSRGRARTARRPDGKSRSALRPLLPWTPTLPPQPDRGRYPSGSRRAAAIRGSGGGLGPPPDQLLPLSHRHGRGGWGVRAVPGTPAARCVRHFRTDASHCQPPQRERGSGVRDGAADPAAPLGLGAGGAAGTTRPAVGMAFRATAPAGHGVPEPSRSRRSKKSGKVLATQPGSRRRTPGARRAVIAKLIAIRWSS